MSIQAIGGAPATSLAPELQKATAPAPQAQSTAVPVDKVTISPAAQKVTSGDPDHDGH